MLARCRPFLDDPLAVQGKLYRRIERFIKELFKELFVFVAEPDVPSENNAAERSLRHLVTSRKISGGTRSDQSRPRESGGYRHQDVSRFPHRYLARQGPKPLHRVPSVAHFPSTLNVTVQTW